MEAAQRLAPVTSFADIRSLEPQGLAATTSDQGPRKDATGKLVLAGLGAGAVGWLSGLIIGANLTDRGEYGALIGGFWGSAIGGTLGIATGVHLANGRRGNFGYDILMAGGVWMTGAMVLPMLGGADAGVAAFMLGVPIVQLFATASIELKESQKRHDLKISLVPSGIDGLGVRASVGF